MTEFTIVMSSGQYVINQAWVQLDQRATTQPWRSYAGRSMAMQCLQWDAMQRSHV